MLWFILFMQSVFGREYQVIGVIESDKPDASVAVLVDTSDGSRLAMRAGQRLPEMPEFEIKLIRRGKVLVSNGIKDRYLNQYHPGVETGPSYPSLAEGYQPHENDSWEPPRELEERSMEDILKFMEKVYNTDPDDAQALDDREFRTVY